VGSVVKVPIVLGCFFLLWAVWERMVYKHSLATDRMERIQAPWTTEELTRDDAAQIVEPPASITEFTTRHLDATVSQEDKS